MKMLFVPLFIAVALIFAIFVPLEFSYKVEWFLFGLYFKVDILSKQFLLFSTFIWFISSIYAIFSIKTRQKEFFFWFLMTFIGNFGLCVSYDAFGFYMFFSIMTFGAFGMIIHDKTHEAKKAGFTYIKYAIFGEILIFLGLINSIESYGSLSFDSFYSSSIGTFTILLLIGGFGIKAGMFFLHSWLPFAHSQAPVSASAVLSGVMLKTGVLGWMRFMPNIQDDTAGYILIICGILGIYGGIYGITQNKIKVVLAYSSISQMGYLVVLFGLYLLNPMDQNTIIYAIMFCIFHHAINKSALFLLSGEILQNGFTKFNILLVLIPILSLIGLPLSSGMVAKEFIKSSTDIPFLIFLIGLSSFVTALLMVRFFTLSMKITPKTNIKSLLIIVLPLVLVSILLPFTITFDFSFDIMQVLPLFFAVVVFLYLEKKSINIPYLPTGDMLLLFEKINIKLNIKKEFNKIEYTHDYENKRFNIFLFIEHYLQNQKVVFLIFLILIVVLSGFLL
ncbi:complex I subunit 5 family protein [Arcobacter sp. FWKO B]|uniref:complex I subunit 5 family protein n=1 Tax=Arcobacter sp. FWKO B TaxID=2593672 RepID=UPI0018A5C306|nr:proton-conducting transporter membrane subunit [Arcobacter sp. FWKO B]QOG13159.1 hypothetical protein FWKOB_10860 [Arcobacter sp. FWKO B]